MMEAFDPQCPMMEREVKMQLKAFIVLEWKTRGNEILKFVLRESDFNAQVVYFIGTLANEEFRCAASCKSLVTNTQCFK